MCSSNSKFYTSGPIRLWSGVGVVGVSELERWIWIRTLGSASHAMGSHCHKRQATAETGIYEAFCICSEAKVFRGGGVEIWLELEVWDWYWYRYWYWDRAGKWKRERYTDSRLFGVDKGHMPTGGRCERGGLH